MTANVTHLIPLAEQPLRVRVAANIRAELARYGIQQVRVAQILGVTQQAVSQKLSGRRPFSIDDLEMIAPLVGMSPDELVRGSTSPRPVDPDGGDVRHQGLEPRTRCISVFAGQDERTYQVADVDPADVPDRATAGELLPGPWAAVTVAA